MKINGANTFTVLVAIALSACGDSTTGSDAGPSDHKGFAALPTGNTPVTVSGTMNGWFYEGDGGCFGSLEAGSESISLWSDVDKCEHVEYEDGESATVEIVYRQDNQYMAGQKMYTVVGFQ